MMIKNEQFGNSGQFATWQKSTVLNPARAQPLPPEIVAASSNDEVACGYFKFCWSRKVGLELVPYSVHNWP